MKTTQIDREAAALARCYALLIRKAQERRARLASKNEAKNSSQSCNEIGTDDTEMKKAPK